MVFDARCDSITGSSLVVQAVLPLMQASSLAFCDLRSVLVLQVAREEGFASKLAHPVHDACFYLDNRLRRRLWREHGVRSYHFVQCEGEAVFIPAGCPHQVLNFRSSIKVAADFVSPYHIAACIELTEQFRQLPRGGASGCLQRLASHRI